MCCIFDSDGTLYAQAAKRSLTLDECIALAQKQSPAAKIARANFDSQRYNSEAFDADFLPQFRLSGRVPGLNRSITAVEQNDGTTSFIKRSQLNSVADISISQKIPLTGGEFSISTGITRLDEFDVPFTNAETLELDTISHKLSWNSTPLTLNYTQPLFQFNSQKWDRKLQPIRNSIDQKRFAEAMEDIAVDVTGKFFQVYIAQKNVQSAEFNVSVNDTTYKISQGRFNVGKIAENELLQNELALMNARIRLDEVRLDFDVALQDLLKTLGLPRNTDLEIVIPQTILSVDIDPDFAVAQAKQNRSDAESFTLQEMEAEQNVERAERANGFSATLSASVGFTGSATSNNSNTSLSSAYEDLANSQSANVSFEIPLFQWGKGSANVEAAYSDRIRLLNSLQLQRTDFEQEVYVQALRFKQLRQKVLTSAISDTIATRRYEVARNRYLIGKIDISDLLIAQSEKDNARTSYIQSLREFWVAYYRLRRSTVYDFITGSKIEYNY